MCHAQKLDHIKLIKPFFEGIAAMNPVHRDLYAHYVWIPIIGWMKIDQVPYFDHGTYVFFVKNLARGCALPQNRMICFDPSQ